MSIWINSNSMFHLGPMTSMCVELHYSTRHGFLPIYWVFIRKFLIIIGTELGKITKSSCMHVHTHAHTLELFLILYILYKLEKLPNDRIYYPVFMSMYTPYYITFFPHTKYSDYSITSFDSSHFPFPLALYLSLEKYRLLRDNKQNIPK